MEGETAIAPSMAWLCQGLHKEVYWGSHKSLHPSSVVLQEHDRGWHAVLTLYHAPQGFAPHDTSIWSFRLLVLSFPAARKQRKVFVCNNLKPTSKVKPFLHVSFPNWQRHLAVCEWVAFCLPSLKHIEPCAWYSIVVRRHFPLTEVLKLTWSNMRMVDPCNRTVRAAAQPIWKNCLVLKSSSSMSMS